MHEGRGSLDELLENSKKCAILRLVYARGLLSSSLDGSSTALSLEAHFFMINSNKGIKKTEASIDYDMDT